VNNIGFKPFAETISLNANETSVVELPWPRHGSRKSGSQGRGRKRFDEENLSPAQPPITRSWKRCRWAQQKFRDALPLVPGVIRTLDGKLSVRGTSENQGMLQVDSAKTVDPVTGSFSIPVPIDAIQTVNVDKTPFSAENGGFSGGLTAIETTRHRLTGSTK